jgi:hypothetical protein
MAEIKRMVMVTKTECGCLLDDGGYVMQLPWPAMCELHMLYEIDSAKRYVGMLLDEGEFIEKYGIAPEYRERYIRELAKRLMETKSRETRYFAEELESELCRVLEMKERGELVI